MLCGALANLYAKSRLEGKEPPFLRETDPFKVFHEAYNLDQSQIRQYYAGDKEAQWNTLKNRKMTVFTSKTSPEQFSQALQRFNLITFPNSSMPNDNHMVYFEKGPDQCRIFNANVTRGERRGACDEMIKQLAETVFKYQDGGKKVIVASTDGKCP